MSEAAGMLRRAAALMRERAEAARSGVWLRKNVSVMADWYSEPRMVAMCSGSLAEGNVINADHIASWHPAVALAVTEMLSVIAAEFEHGDHDEAWEPYEAALDLAAAYLGTKP